MSKIFHLNKENNITFTFLSKIKRKYLIQELSISPPHDILSWEAKPAVSNSTMTHITVNLWTVEEKLLCRAENHEQTFGENAPGLITLKRTWLKKSAHRPHCLPLVDRQKLHQSHTQSQHIKNLFLHTKYFITCSNTQIRLNEKKKIIVIVWYLRASWLKSLHMRYVVADDLRSIYPFYGKKNGFLTF